MAILSNSTVIAAHHRAVSHAAKCHIPVLPHSWDSYTAMMRILSVAASTAGFRTPAANDARSDALDWLLDNADPNSIIHLPVGYWTLDRGRMLKPFLNGLAKRFTLTMRSKNLWIVGGVDILPVPWKDIPRLVALNRLPFFGFAINGHGLINHWRQISTTGRDATAVPPPSYRQIARRMLVIAEKRLIHVVCGEMHNPRLRAEVGRLAPAIVLVSGHKGLGQGLLPALAAMRECTRCPVIHVQHLAPTTSGRVHWIDAKGIHRSNRVKATSPHFGVDGYWLSRHVTSRWT